MLGIKPATSWLVSRHTDYLTITIIIVIIIIIIIIITIIIIISATQCQFYFIFFCEFSGNWFHYCPPYSLAVLHNVSYTIIMLSLHSKKTEKLYIEKHFKFISPFYFQNHVSGKFVFVLDKTGNFKTTFRWTPF